jgi:hypothetical protein
VSALVLQKFQNPLYVRKVRGKLISGCQGLYTSLSTKHGVFTVGNFKIPTLPVNHKAVLPFMLTTNKTYSRYFTPSEFYINTEAAMSYSRMLKRLGMYIFIVSYSCSPQFVLHYAKTNSAFTSIISHWKRKKFSLFC